MANLTDINAGLAPAAQGAVAWGDYDGDGNLDLVISGGNTSDGPFTKVYKNDGSGGFSEDTNANLPGVLIGYDKDGSVAWGDYDGDDDLDLLINGSNDSGFITKIYKNEGTSGFSEDTNTGLPANYRELAVAWRDFDGDGDLDYLMTATGKIYNNNGSGVYTEDPNVNLPIVGNSTIETGDFDKDGDLDLAITGLENNNGNARITKIYNNEGTNGFSENTNANLDTILSGSITAGDFDGDSDLDLLITGQDNTNTPTTKIYKNDGSGGFDEDTNNANLTGVYRGGTVTGDFDNDGDIDLIITGNATDNVVTPTTKIYENDGSGGFSEDTNSNLINVDTGSVAAGDYDGDSDLDLAIVGSPETAKIYRNDSPPNNLGRDYFVGTAAADTIDGGESNDTLVGGAGADSLIGGDGRDRADYRQSAAAVTVDLLANTATGGDADGDTFDSIEDIDGSRLGDALTGDNNDNRIYGGNGDDTIVGNDGNDYLSGQNGNDSIEGGTGDDRLLGGNGDDILMGGAGNDFVYGGAGADSITGADTTTNGVGEIDRLSDGTGADVFVLGTTGTAYYDDGVNTTNGISDYALIYNFNPTEGDAIELSSSQTYYLGANPLRTLSGTGIFIDNDGTAGLSDNDELVGLLEGSTLASGQITGSTDGFSLV